MSTFYNTEMLTKRGPLARVWMASHLSARLTKTTLLSTSIPSSVSSIISQDLGMALRLSGQLLLGVARIYSRQAKYLLEDCNETLSKVKKAFGKSGVVVDLDEGEGRGRDAITLRAEGGGLEDILGYDDGDWDVNYNNAAPVAGPSGTGKGKGKANIAGVAADIDLPPLEHDFDLGYGDDDDVPMYDLGPEGALVFDLGLGDLLDDDAAADAEGSEVGRGRKRSASAMDNEVELGRREEGANASERSGSVVSNMDFGGGNDEFEKAGEGMDLGTGDDRDMGGFDNFDFGGGDEVFAGDRERTPQAAPEANGDVDEAEKANDSYGLTPKTAADLAAKKDPKSSPNKKQKVRKQVVDRVTELDWDAGSKTALEAKKELLFTEPHFLPRSRTHLRLLERADDPTYYLPKPLDDAGNMFVFAPPGLAPQLQQLFKLPSRRALIKTQGRERSPDRDVEAGRRAAFSPMLEFDHNDFGGGDESFEGAGGLGMDAFGDQDDMGGHDEFQFDVPDVEEDGEDRKAAEREKDAKRRKMIEEHDLAVDEDLAGGANDEEPLESESVGALAVFDQAGSATATQTQTQSGVDEDEDIERAKGKWSKNTMKAVSVLRGEIKGEGQSVEFEKVAGNASRRAAASFFFELLVLSTRDCIDVKQTTPYGAIKIEAKDKLFSGVIVDAEEVAA